MNTVNSPMVEKIVERDLSSQLDYTRLAVRLAETVHRFGDANTAYKSLGRAGMLAAFSEVSPDSFAILMATRRDVERGSGVVVLHGSEVNAVDDQTAQLVSVTLGSVYGEPTKTDRRLAQIAWPVKYDPDTKVVRTFSQSLGEAAFHTDTQYFAYPEEYFGLFCIASDVPGKGTNKLLRVEDIVRSLRDNYGEQSLQKLAMPYPFRVPSVFTASGRDSDVEITRAPILDEAGSRIRYRKDTIDKALQEPGIEVDTDQMIALQQLESVLCDLQPIEYHLQPGDGIVINNLRLLHARTAFDDPDRSLYRVRMRKDLQDEI